MRLGRGRRAVRSQWFGCIDLWGVLRCLWTHSSRGLLLQNERATLLIKRLRLELSPDVQLSTTLAVGLFLPFKLLLGLGVGDLALHSFD